MNIFKIFFYALLYLFGTQICYTQVKVGEWNSLTSYLQIRDIEFIDNTLFAATEGGILSLFGDEYNIITNIDGLEGVDILSIEKDNFNNLWIGGNSPSGLIQYYDPFDKKSLHSFDFQLTAIHDIQVTDSITWMLFQDGQDNGLMKFNFDEEWYYKDIYKNFPDQVTKLNCFLALDSMILVGTDDGIYSSNIKNNLKNPLSWTKLIGNINDNVSSMDSNIEYLVFTTHNRLFKYYFNSNELIDLNLQLDNVNTNNILLSNNEYCFSDNNHIYLYDDDGLITLDVKYNILSVSKNNDNYIVGTDNGITFLNRKVETGVFEKRLFTPNSPVTNSFSAIEVLQDGRLVGGSSKGVSIFSGEGWRNILEIKEMNTEIIHESYNYDQFIADTVEFDFGEFIADIEEGPDGLIYCSIRGSRIYNSNPPRWSGGIIIVDVDNPANISLIDTTYLSYYTSSNNNVPYQVVLDVEFDKNGNMWVANPYCNNGNNPIHVKSPDGIWKHYGSKETETSLSHTPISISFDSFGRTWVSSFQASGINIGLPNGGISMLNFDGEPFNPYSFSWSQISTNGTVWSIGLGNNDRLYYLTPSGLNYYDLKVGSYPIAGENLYPYFPNISFGSGSKLNIDSQGNIWAGSSSMGVYVLQENTSYWPNINGLNASNSYLLSNEIRDIEFDHHRNLVYISTSKGVSVLKIPFGLPKRNYNNVKIFPSPYHLPSNYPLIIDGIIYESHLKVLTLNGSVIRNVVSNGMQYDGQQISWDGKDEKGNYVETGVYLLMIFNKDGKRIIEKITVINNS